MLKAPVLRSALARAPQAPSPAVVRTVSSSASASVRRLGRLGPAAAQHPVQWAAYTANRTARIGASPRARNFWSSSSSSSSANDSSSSGRSQQQQQQNKEQEQQGSAESEDPQKIPLTQKVKYLFRKYGWTTLVVYLGLSAVDFGLCFLVIYSVGADRVRSAEDWVLDKLHWKRRSDDKDKAEGGGGTGSSARSKGCTNARTTTTPNTSRGPKRTRPPPRRTRSRTELRRPKSSASRRRRGRKRASTARSRRRRSSRTRFTRLCSCRFGSGSRSPSRPRWSGCCKAGGERAPSSSSFFLIFDLSHLAQEH